MVDPTELDATPGESALETAIQARLNAIDAGNTRRANQTALETFKTFLQRERGVDSLDELGVTDCRRFAEYLRNRSRLDNHEDDALSASTARQYYERVRATCAFWVEDERLDTNPAEARRATKPLPEDTADPDRQLWTPRQREVLLRATDQAVDEVLDATASGDARQDAVLQTFRDRTLAYLLAWTGVRGGEVLRDPSDSDRNGLRWADTSADGVLRILGKSRETEYSPLRDPVRRRLERWEGVLEPPTDEWPVFPLLSKGQLRANLEEQLDGPIALDSDASVEERLAIYREEDLVPPSISTNAGRGVMQRLTKAAGIDIDEGYLRPHGGRRGLGDQIYDKDPVKAQDTLRHKSIETTNEAYRDKQQSQLAASLDEMFDGEGDDE